MQTPLTFFFAFVVVLALIGLAAWLARRCAGNRLGANANRGRMPRLAVIDATAVDNRRRLVLVRRDNIEHLLMIGGPTDIVVEANIVRATTARDQAPQRNGAGAEPPPRITPLPDAAIWTDDPLDLPEPQMPEPPSRPVRAAFGDEVRRPSERREALTGFTPEPLTTRPQPLPSRRSEPAMARAPPPPPPRPRRRDAVPPPWPARRARSSSRGRRVARRNRPLPRHRLLRRCPPRTTSSPKEGSGAGRG